MKRTVLSLACLLVSASAFAGAGDAIVKGTHSIDVDVKEIVSTSVNGGGFGVSVGSKAVTNVGVVEAMQGGTVDANTTIKVKSNKITNTNSEVNVGVVRAGAKSGGGGGGAGGGGVGGLVNDVVDFIGGLF